MCLFTHRYNLPKKLKITHEHNYISGLLKGNSNFIHCQHYIFNRRYQVTKDDRAFYLTIFSRKFDIIYYFCQALTALSAQDHHFARLRLSMKSKKFLLFWFPSFWHRTS
jgi:hypothetical protein